MKNELKMALIESIKQVTMGLDSICSILEQSVSEVETVAKEGVKVIVEEKVTDITPKAKEVVVVEEPVEEVKKPVALDLEGMTYNQLKSLAKEKGLNTKGTKADLIERILADATTGAPVEEELEEVVVEEPVIEDAEPEEDVEELVEGVLDEEEEVEVPEEVEENLADRIERELADYSLEDLAEILESIGKSPKGKRQVLLSRIVQAIEDGELEFEDEEDSTADTEEVAEEVVEEVEEVATEDEEVAEDEDEFPFDGEYFNLDEMTPERRDAIIEAYNDVVEQYNNDELPEEEIDDILSQFYTEEDGYTPQLPIEDKIEMFIMAYCRLIDDEGVQHEFEDPYTIEDAPVCCGHFLQETEDGNLMCVLCESEYEVE